jgi:predicted ABC-type ATPase
LQTAADKTNPKSGTNQITVTLPLLYMKRFRVFAGPNGSRKSSIIKLIKANIVNDHTVHSGIYIDADDISASLAAGTFSFHDYDLNFTDDHLLRSYVAKSGLLLEPFTAEVFNTAYTLSGNSILLPDVRY